MATAPFQLTIRGLRERPDILEVNVRSGPNTAYTLLFKVAVGMSGLVVMEARADDKGNHLNGKIYQWLRVTFPNGEMGWVRDDLVDVVGDGSRFGYGTISKPTPAFSLTRTQAVAPVGQVMPVVPAIPVNTSPSPAAPPAAVTTPVSAPAPTPSPAVTTPAPVTAPGPIAAPLPGDTTDRVRKAAFNITGAFEGGGYATYQTYDAGIVSYGRFQFTLAAGSFITVINRFLERSGGATANELRNYLPRLNAKDEGLRQDARLKELCIAAASEAVMQQIQDEVATEGYYLPVFELSINPRGITLPLSQALIFDMAINHGRFNHLLPKAEEVLGVPNKSRVGQNGVSEHQFISKLAELRRDNLYALANKHNLPGLKKRGDFWVNIVAAGDWNLRGDTNGTVNINGKIVQVRNP